MVQFDVAGHEPSFLPDESFRLTWQDEFDGVVLDRTKWDFRLHMMGTRWISWTDSEKALYLDGKSNAVFRIIRDEEDGHLCCAQLQTGYNFMDAPPVTRHTEEDRAAAANCFGDMPTWGIGRLKDSLHLFRYGYFECRCRLQKMPKWWSAFWMQSPIIGASRHAYDTGAEVDIMESFRPGEIKPHNVFTGGYSADVNRIKVGGKAVDVNEYHRFGLLWEPDRYVFYIDGEADGVITENVSQIPEFLLISTEVSGYRKEAHAPYPEAYAACDEGDEFLVDYVRVFQRG
ncbi:MAG: glycoside hydrolase family 16 protein [Clostridia bacterium]|nr:glycoside hydrolase family 16 protein [Clostridia bacterium]